ncbi:MAG TPA: M1 family aminopeptidase [Candidatus Cybelea sp.]|nr:M1 family aminopeptidase [Candidatus Cybelea sp.]
MKLTTWARQQGLSYKTLWRLWKADKRPVPAERVATGRVMIHAAPANEPPGVALYARVSSGIQKADLDRQLFRLAVFSAGHGLRVVEAARETGSAHFLFPAIVGLLCMVFAPAVHADTISGTVRDPSGGVVIGARIEITGDSLPQPLLLTSDDSGKFMAPHLNAGRYSVRVDKEGFNELVTPVDLQGTRELLLELTITAQQSSVTVNEKSLAFANSDTVYRQLRNGGLGDTYRCENFTLKLDVGTFELKTGTITFLALVNKFETGAVFVGQGHFTLKPLTPLDTNEMLRRAGSATAEEDFTEVVFRFSPNQFPQFAGTLGTRADTPAEAGTAFQHWKDRVRHRHEVPEGLTQALLENETIDNVDADVLAAIYNPKHPPFFNAYLHGSQHKDLRFFVRERVGAIPQIDSPEEVALVNCSGGGMDDGIWYFQHLKSELQAHTASSQQERRLFATRRYNIETVIGKNDHLFSRATIMFAPLVAGERVMKFGLLPTLRVTRVSGEKGEDLHFIQENRKEDGSFYAILEEAPSLGQTQAITVEYSGDKVVTNAGSGSYYVGARESWYPNLNGFGEKTIYDLTFKVPPSNVLISVGKLEGQHTEEGFAVTHWVTPVPIAVAGFNYGQYKKMDYPDTITQYEIAGYYLTELPDSLRGFGGNASGSRASNPIASQALSSMAPASMTKYALAQARAQMQLCTHYFGKGPYENVYITEQPNFNFGQSWPNLVYLPISAYIDATQRWMMFGHIDTKFTGFVEEVTPHEVAHQWFGHGVGWASYHDQWLSEGFAEFAAGLFLQQAVGPKWQKDYIEFWDRQRSRILEKNNYGVSPNEAGPLWMGIRLISPRTGQAYQGVTYAKGAYVLGMLKSLMRADMGSAGDPDQAFIDMMHDFMESHRDTPASTESFKVIAEKHMTPKMDLQLNGKLDWFFREWVWGTEVPRYRFKYEVQPVEGGKFKVHAEITQSEVDENFAMYVPIFADFGNGMVRLTQAVIAGNSTKIYNFTVDRQPKKVAINAYKEILER